MIEVEVTERADQRLKRPLDEAQLPVGPGLR